MERAKLQAVWASRSGGWIYFQGNYKLGIGRILYILSRDGNT